MRQGVERVREIEAVFKQLGFEHHLVVDRELGAAILFGIEREQPALGAEFFGQAAAKLVLVGIFASRPGSRPAQVLVAFELLGEPSADLVAKFHDMGRICTDIKIHGSLLFSRSQFRVPSFELRRGTRNP